MSMPPNRNTPSAAASVRFPGPGARWQALAALAVLAGAAAACGDDATDPASPPATANTQTQAGAGGSAAQAGGNASSAGAGGTTNAAGAGGAAAAPGASGAGGSTSQAGAGGTAAGAGASAGAGDAGAAGAGPDVAPACAKGGFYDFSAKDLGGADDVSMCDYAGKVVLVVNVASKCGYTPQYKPLESLYKAYVDKGFVVLGFPSADFGNQEFADDADISAFCTTNYGITFPMFSRIDVKGPNQHPLYTWLTKQPGGEGEITWNFNKFLLDRHGVFVQRFDSAVQPDSAAVTDAVEAELAKP